MNEGQKIPLQQTEAWQKLQQDLHQTTFFLSNKVEKTSGEKSHLKTTSSLSKNSSATDSGIVNYQMLIIKKSTPLGPYFYLPYGPYLRQKSAAKPAYEALRALVKHEHVIFTRIEPQNAEIASYWLSQPKTKKSQNLSPEETWVLSLTPPLDEIYQNMKQTTRNLAKNYTKKSLTVKKVAKTDKNRQILQDLLETVAKNRHFHPIERTTLKAELDQPFSSLYFAYYLDPAKNQTIPVAASLFFDDQTTRYYMQSAAHPEYKKLPATLAILAEAIKDAKAKNLQTFDFWGIAPENAPENHPWAGFTKFKKSFGGAEVSYAGTYDLVHRPFRYRLYTLLRKLNRFLRRS